jgi:hypothetical protein
MGMLCIILRRLRAWYVAWSFMKITIKKVIITLIILAVLGYVGYMLYEYVVELTIQRIRRGVIGGIGSMFNPVNWVKHLVGK